MFLRMASTWFYGLRDLPERFFAQIVVKVVEVCNDLFVLLENVIAEKIHKNVFIEHEREAIHGFKLNMASCDTLSRVTGLCSLQLYSH